MSPILCEAAVCRFCSAAVQRLTFSSHLCRIQRFRCPPTMLHASNRSSLNWFL